MRLDYRSGPSARTLRPRSFSETPRDSGPKTTLRATETACIAMNVATTVMQAAQCELPPTFPGTLYVLSLDRLNSREWAFLECCMGRAEQERAAGFRFAEDRNAYVAAHGLVRIVLGHRLSSVPSALRFSNDGKSRLLHSRGNGIDFSLAHTRGCVACAVSNGFGVGVDVEREGTTTPPPHTWLSQEERAWLSRKLGTAQAAASLDLWCRKEALAKALGLGVAVDFTRLQIPLDNGPLRSMFLRDNDTAGSMPSAANSRGFHVGVAAAPYRVVGSVRENSREADARAGSVSPSSRGWSTGSAIILGCVFR